MRKKAALFSVLIGITFILIAGCIFMFLPKRIVSSNDYIVGLELKYRNSEVNVDQQKIIKILSKYDARLSLTNYFPYETDKVDYEIYYVNNNKPTHVLLGNFNIWYESTGRFSYDILDAQKLKDELKDALK